MAYLEIHKDEDLLKKRYIKDQAAEKGLRFQLGSLGQVHIGLGETKTVGSYTVRLVSDEAVSDQNNDFGTTDESPAAGELDALQFSTDGTQPSQPVTDELPDIEGYRVIALLGQGGMGTVWRAEQLSTKREVALKVMASDYDRSSKAQTRFELEVELTASLDHPNIATLYDSGLCQGIYYYAMELLEGVSLDRFVRDNKLSQTKILDLIIKICHALQYAHQRGVIHRDLKPSNILVSPDSEPHIVDFGLAQVFWGSQKDVSVSTERGVAGTPAFMAPEQAAGHIEIMDTRSDVFSLGVILFGLLTGESPHDLSGSAPDVLKRVQQGQKQQPRAVMRSMDRDLEAVLLKALALDMDDRYLSAGALADDLTKYLDGDPVSAQIPTIRYFLRKKARKYRIQIGAAVLAVLILSGAGLFGYTKWVAYRTRVQEIKLEAEQGRLAEERLKWTELELMILGDDKNAARAALRNMRDLHIDALDENTKLKANEWLPPPVVRHVGLLTGEPLSPLSLVKRPVLPPGVQSWTIETDVHRGPIQILAGDLKGRRMASCGIDGTIRVWDRQRGELECIFVPSASQCSGLAWLANGKYLVSCSNRPSAKITVWDVDMQQRACTVPLGDSGSDADCLAISLDANYIACRFSASNDIHILQMIDMNKAQQVKTLTVGTARAQEFAWAHDDQFLAMIDEKGHLSVWDWKTGELAFRLPDDHSEITAMAWSPRNTHLAVSFLSGDPATPVEIELWDINKRSILESIRVKAFSSASHAITQLAWCANGQSLAFMAKGNIGLWDREARLAKSLDITGVTEMAWLKDSDILAIGDSYGSLFCLEKNAGRITQSWISNWCGPAYTTAFSPQGDRLAVLSGNGLVSLWETRTWKTSGGFLVQDVDPEDHVLAWSSSGNEVVVGSAEGKFEVFDSYSLRQVRAAEHIQQVKDELNLETRQAGESSSTFSSPDASRPVAPGTEILSVANSPGNGYVLAAAADGTVRIWDAANDSRGHALLMPLWGPRGSGIAFSNEGDFRGPSKIIKQLRYVTQTEHGHRTWRPEEFRNEHGWVNEPWQVGVFELGDEAIQRIYVKPNMDSKFRGDGLSWDTAYVDLQDALGSASEGTEIWVAAGTYKPDRDSGLRDASFQLKSNVRLYGGFAGNETSLHQRSEKDNPTILSGDLYGNDQYIDHKIENNGENSYHVVKAERIGEDSLLDGFVIAGGSANKPKREDVQISLDQIGGGVLIQSSVNPTIQNCRFEHNYALYRGGGLELYDGTITVVNCQFIQNHSGHAGGGANTHAQTALFSHCLFKENHAGIGGGGLHDGCDGSLIIACDFLGNEALEGGGAVQCLYEMTFVRCRFVGNHTGDKGGAIWQLWASPLHVLSCSFFGNSTEGRGGAIASRRGRVSIENCGFIDNSAGKMGGAIGSLGGDLKVINCSLVRNRVTRDSAEDMSAGGIDHHFEPNQSTTLYLANTVFWRNSNRRGFSKGAQVKAPSMKASHCCIQGWTSHAAGQGSVDADPLFEDLDGPDNELGTLDDDLRLNPESPLIDSGDDALLSLDAYDLDQDHDVNEAMPLDLLGDIRVRGKNVDIGACETSPGR
jgi:predicted outer membrane repeat protein